MLRECIKLTPSHICIVYNSQRRSVNIKSSSITRSNNSPPLILKFFQNKKKDNSSLDNRKTNIYNSIIRQISLLVSKAS